jgi:hypothetical protein
LPSCGVARYGVYGQRLRYRWYSPDRKRRRSAVGHRRLVFSIGSPPPAPRRAPTRCRRLPPMGATFAFKSRTNFTVQSVWGFSTTVRD